MSRPRSTRRAALRATPSAIAPLGALAAGFGLLTLSGAALAQQAAAPAAAAASAPAAEAPAAAVGAVLPVVTVRGNRIDAPGKQTLNVSNTSIGKGNQALRDIPQSVTVVTEKLMDDRNLDTMKEALKNAAGITFLAAEGGEEDIRLRGFSLQSSGDVFVDGMRDPAFYERDTFNLDRLELMRGSASMLFGRGSTGGAVNMVTKTPRLVAENEVDFTVGSHGYKRAVGDFNIVTGESSALRLGAMVTDADNNGAGSSLNKRGMSASVRTGIGERDEFSASLYHLDNNNGMNYGMPYIRATATSTVANQMLPLDPTAYYGMASDRNNGQASYITLGHVHRFSSDTELNTKLRVGSFKRDQRAGTVRLAGAAAQPGGLLPTLENFSAATVINRGTQLKIQDLHTVYLQSDYSDKFEAWGAKHHLLGGADMAIEKRGVFGARTVAQGGVVPVKPTTTIGTPNDGATVNEDSRVLYQTNQFESTGFGLYLQDLVQVAPHWKLLAGLRYDNLKGDYATYTAAGATTSYTMKVSEVSKRVGALYQPNDLQSYHFSAATSFNTSGETYSLNAANKDIPPEQSINVELGAKLDTADRKFTTRVGVFRSTKLHERNTDPLVTDLITLSGKRHVAGAELDITGRLTPQWEVFGSYMWMPVAKIDISSATGANVELQGSRPSLTPRHSGTIWTTYQFTPRWRAGGGLNARSSQTPNRNPVGVVAKAYVTGDLMAEYQLAENGLTLKANLSNVTNKLYAESLYANGHYIPGAGRMLQVTASLKF